MPRVCVHARCYRKAARRSLRRRLPGWQGSSISCARCKKCAFFAASANTLKHPHLFLRCTSRFLEQQEIINEIPASYIIKIYTISLLINSIFSPHKYDRSSEESKMCDSWKVMTNAKMKAEDCAYVRVVALTVEKRKKLFARVLVKSS